MPPESSACWQKLRDRRTLVNSEQCLLDLDARVQVLEAQIKPSNLPANQSAAKPGHGGTVNADVGSDDNLQSEERMPDISPIPVNSRLPELHELDRQGRCWAYRSTTHEPLGKAWVLGTPVSLQLTRSWCSFTHWLPHWCLPVVEEADS